MDLLRTLLRSGKETHLIHHTHFFLLIFGQTINKFSIFFPLIPHRFSEEDTAVNYFGEQLLAAGYNYYGNEPMYSGITGQEFAADIYLGVVYYQRLRHMVLDKYQVRTTGPVDRVTQQPVKGRKRAGGIRFGEMERDALIAHGTSYLLQDRLMNCSDYSTAWVCRTCGSLISLGYEDAALGSSVYLSSSSSSSSSYPPSGGENTLRSHGVSTQPNGEYCRVCKQASLTKDDRDRQRLALDHQHSSHPHSHPHSESDPDSESERKVDYIQPGLKVSVPSSNVLSAPSPGTKGGNLDVIAVPFVFRYLCSELAAMGIAVSLEVQ